MNHTNSNIKFNEKQHKKGDNDNTLFEDISYIPVVGCDSGHYQCLSDGFCLPDKLTCDGVPDCDDLSDETFPCCMYNYASVIEL